MQVSPTQFYKPEKVFNAAKTKIQNVNAKKDTIDYITIVPDGEPTLDQNLGTHIDLLKELGIKIAVITNASLLWNTHVQHNLARADWVSLKIDAVTHNVWRTINRPHTHLDLDTILNGIKTFSEVYTGELTTETMLVHGINDSEPELKNICDFIHRITPSKSYVAIPTRPPAEPWVTPPSEQKITTAYQLFAEKISTVEYLIGYEGNEFAFTGNVKEDLLSITSVHPMREDGVNTFLSKAHAEWDIVKELIDAGDITEVVYKDKKFYMRTLPDTPSPQ
jgi:wyosine [tRNA(Phe)-imidazoG37] synthetase (radical SAM superfamily)